MSQKTTSLLGASMRLQGRLELTGSVRIDGGLKGDLISAGVVYVGEQAEIIGNIRAQALISSGKIEGDLTARDYVMLHPPGSLRGNVTTRNFHLADGVRFEGVCTILQDEETPP